MPLHDVHTKAPIVISTYVGPFCEHSKHCLLNSNLTIPLKIFKCFSSCFLFEAIFTKLSNDTSGNDVTWASDYLPKKHFIPRYLYYGLRYKSVSNYGTHLRVNWSIESLCKYIFCVNSLDLPNITNHLACYWFVNVILTSF